MRLPSVRAAADAARGTAGRFPAVLVCALVAAVAATRAIGQSDASEHLEAVIAAATLGFAMFVALGTAAERGGTRGARIAVWALGAAALVALALAWPHWTMPVRVRRYAQFAIGLHLLVAFLPYLRGREPNAFWQYNRTLFLRFLTAAIHSGVLFVGLAIALAALEHLFKVKVPGNAYARLWVWMAFVFNTWFFLGGVPRDLAALEHRRDYPRALKVFAQFILIPLVIVYLLMLTAYLVRIIVTGEWPSGWIGYLVSSVSAAGILSLLLVHPIRDDEGQRWVGAYTRWFYVALVPAIGMLLAAIWKRIDQYGVTEDRYFIAVLALWLAGIAVAFIVNRRTDIRWIPITLCVIAFGTVFGPWSAYDVSRASQTRRLETLLTEHGMLADGVVTPARTDPGFEVRKNIGSKVFYLLDVHGAAPVREVLGDAVPVLDADTAKVGTRRRTTAHNDTPRVMKTLGLTWVGLRATENEEHFGWNPWRPVVHAVDLHDDDYHVHLPGTLPSRFEIDGRDWRARHVKRTLVLQPVGGEAIRLPLDTLVTFAREHPGGRDSTAAPVLVGEVGGVRVRFVPGNYNGFAKGDSIAFWGLTGDLYFRLPRP